MFAARSCLHNVRFVRIEIRRRRGVDTLFEREKSLSFIFMILVFPLTRRISTPTDFDRRIQP